MNTPGLEKIFKGILHTKEKEMQPEKYREKINPTISK
jgi:hypothetical protein